MSAKQIELLYSINMSAEEALDTAEDEIGDLGRRATLFLWSFEEYLQRAYSLSNNISKARSLDDYAEAKQLEQQLEGLQKPIQKAKALRSKIQDTPFIKEQGLSLGWLPFRKFGDLVLLGPRMLPDQKPPQAFWRPCQDNQLRLLVNISHHSGRAFVVSTWTFLSNGNDSWLQIDAFIPEDHSEISDLPLDEVKTIFENNAMDVLRFLVDFAYNKASSETATELLSENK